MTRPATPPWAPDIGYARGAAVTGTGGQLLDIRARITNGMDSFTIHGYPQPDSVAPLRDRIRAAVLNSGLTWPSRTITVDITPPCLHGVGLDLPITVAVLTASGAIPASTIARCVLLADLRLDGSLRPVRGIAPAVTAASRAGIRVAVLAPGDAAEAILAPGLAVVPCPSLRTAVVWLGAASGWVLVRALPGSPDERAQVGPVTGRRLGSSAG